MRRHYRSMSLAVAVLFLVSCAKSAVDQKAATASDSAKAGTSEIVVTGTVLEREAGQVANRIYTEQASPMAVMAPPGPPPPPPAPGMYVPQWASPPYHDQGRDKFTKVDQNAFKV